MKKIVIIGGGLSGLVAANYLAQLQIPVTLFERKEYPFHRVCGEYISNETIPFLTSLQLFPEVFNPPSITQLQLTSVNGRSATLELDLGGFGISRFAFDLFLFEKAKKRGVVFHLNTEVEGVSYSQEKFEVKTKDLVLEADV
ncbi:MAG: NAD-binding protein, partial [Cyclobacteriaceae bacterium]|nr:NAD-binding protein [Cyclobacteriaceae bacterium]